MTNNQPGKALARRSLPPAAANGRQTEVVVVGILLLVIIWTVATLALSRLAWFRRGRPLATRLEPYVDGSDPVQEIEDWLRRRADS